jgi:RNA polymerase-associated protein CTR9
LPWKLAKSQDSESWVALLLLGLAALNNAREPSSGITDRAQSAAEGVTYVQRAFKLNNKCSAAALALSTTAGLDGQLPMASKLAERAIQYADTKHHSVLANAERGRLGFVAGDVADAGPFIAAAKAEDGGVNVIAELTLGQIALKNGQSIH